MALYVKINKNLGNKIFSTNLRTCSTKRFVKDHYADTPDPRLVKSDYIGPPDKESNLRPFVRCILKNESPIAKRLREKQLEVEKWNQLFWLNHNKRFYQEKQDFIALHDPSGMSADKLSEFYKSFLDKNHKVHILYNLSWYIKNFEILLLSFRVAVAKMCKKRHV